MESLVAEQNEFLYALKESGLQAVVHAFKTNESCIEEASYLLLNFGKFNAVELFTDKLLQLISPWNEYTNFCQSIFCATHYSDQGREVIEMTGVLSFWVLQSLKIAESSGEVTIDERIASLVFLTEIWINKADYIDTAIVGSGQATLNILKRAARDIR